MNGRHIAYLDRGSAVGVSERMLGIMATRDKWQHSRVRMSQHGLGDSTRPSVITDEHGSGPAELLLARHAALNYPFQCDFGKAHLEIGKGVFCPTLTNVSPFLLEVVDFQPGELVLDAFAGSGAFGVNAALHGARQVVAFDTSPVAIANVRRNAELNDVQSLIDVRRGTMDESLVPGERFDLVVANPPLLPGKPSSLLASAIYDPQLDATVSFIRILSRHLAYTGRCYLLTSSVVERYGIDIDRLCAEVKLHSLIAAKLDMGYECYRVHRISW
jgi:methylase of polypeptide subunit release factors